MSNILFFSIFIVVIFVLFFIALKIFNKNALYTVGIGSIIGANIYNIGSYPIVIGNFVFGLDSIIYTLFVFCVLLMYIDYGKDDMKSLLYTSLASIFFTALLAFAGTYSQSGLSTGLIWSSLSYINSIIATFIAIWAMIFAYDWLKKRKVNIYFIMVIVLLIALILNTVIYFSLTSLYTGTLGSSFVSSLIGSSIGKVIASIICLFILYVKSRSKNFYGTNN